MQGHGRFKVICFDWISRTPCPYTYQTGREAQNPRRLRGGFVRPGLLSPVHFFSELVRFLRELLNHELLLASWVNRLRSHYNWCLNDRITQYNQQFIQGDYCDIKTTSDEMPIKACTLCKGNSQRCSGCQVSTSNRT